MGKPSKTKIPVKVKSEDSMSRSTLQMVGVKQNPFSTKKRKNKKKKKHRKTKQQIKKLFEKLRNESHITLDSTGDNFNQDNNTTVIVLDNTIKECPKKRKLSDLCLAEEIVPENDNVEPIVITDTKAKPFNSTQTNEIENSESVIITNDASQSCSPNTFSSKKRKVNSDTTLQIQVVTDNDVLHVNPEPCSSKTPQRIGIAPPMKCSTPITKSNTSLVSNNNAETNNRNVDVNETKIINRDSFLTIDLTTDSNLSSLQCNTVIDLDNTNEMQDCTFVSMSNASSMSGDSQLSVYHRNNIRNNNRSKRMHKFVNGIAKLDASEKGRLLELITEKIFSGCKLPERLTGNPSNVAMTTNQATDTAESTYIKEVILGQKQSRNSIGSNIYNPEKDANNKTGLRLIVIDGSNVAMQCKFGKSSEPRVLDELERRGHVVYTPSREIQGKLVASYDDRYIVQCAAEFDGVIVSGDNYRDLLQENPRWRFVIENRLLPFTWVDDMIMFPRDPLGRNGPTLEQFLKHPDPKSIPSIVL